MKDKSVDSSIGQENSLRSTSSIVLPTSDYYSQSSSESFSPSTSTPKAKSRTVASLVEQFNDFTSPNTSGLMRNRRVQTMYATVCTGEETGDLKGGKYEIIQKDIGYSSDADTSDANCDAISNGFVGSTASSASSISEVSSGGFNSKTGTCQSPDTQYKKRQVKRRFRSKLTTSTSCGALTSCTKQRPWSFHAASEWTDWDYYQPPSFIPSTPTPTEPVVVTPIVAPVTVTPPSTRSVATSTSLVEPCISSENNEKVDESKETSYALIVTLSLFSLLLSVFFASNRSAHLELLYPTSSPPI